MAGQEAFRIGIVGAKEAALQYLRNMIITGEFAGGQKLNEIQLSSMLGISRPPIREAFPILESECLISTESRKGVYVTALSIADCEDLYKTRYTIEASAIEVMIEKKMRDFTAMEKSLEMARGQEFPKSGDVLERLEFFRAFSLFHVELVNSSGSKWLKHLYSSISPNLSRYNFLYTDQSLSDPHQYKTAVDWHQLLIDLIRKGRCKEAKESLREHIGTALDFLKKKIKD